MVYSASTYRPQCPIEDGLIRHETVGAAQCHYFRARSVVGIYMQWREADPYGLYGVPKPNA